MNTTGKKPTRQDYDEVFKRPAYFYELTNGAVVFPYINELINNSYIIRVHREEKPENIIQMFSDLAEKHNMELNIHNHFKTGEAFGPRYALKCINDISSYLSRHDYALIALPLLFWGVSCYAFSIIPAQDIEAIQEFKWNGLKKKYRNKHKNKKRNDITRMI